MLIHANIIQLVLNNTYVRKIPFWLSALLTFAFCYFNIHLYYRLYRRVSLSYRYLIRFLQLCEIIVLFFVVAALFHFFRLKMNVIVWITALILTFDAVKIYDKILRKKIGFLKRIPYEFPATTGKPSKKTKQSGEPEETAPDTADTHNPPPTTPNSEETPNLSEGLPPAPNTN